MLSPDSDHTSHRPVTVTSSVWSPAFGSKLWIGKKSWREASLMQALRSLLCTRLTPPLDNISAPLSRLFSRDSRVIGQPGLATEELTSGRLRWPGCLNIEHIHTSGETPPSGNSSRTTLKIYIRGQVQIVQYFGVPGSRAMM